MKSTLSISSLSRQVLLRETRDYLMIALGMILYGIGWTVFLLPNDITTGGVPGIASIVFWATGFPVQYTYFLINAVLLMLALKILGFKFSIKTIFAVFTLTFFLSLIQGADSRDAFITRSTVYGMCAGSLLLRKWYRYRFLLER